jgi:hypothetical protein
MKEAQRFGWKPKIVGHNTVADPVVLDLAGAEALEGVCVNLTTAVDSMDKPAVKNANEILAKYYPQTKPGCYYPYLGMAGPTTAGLSLWRITLAHEARGDVRGPRCVPVACLVDCRRPSPQPAKVGAPALSY